MLEHARKLAWFGKTIYVIADNPDHKKQLEVLFGDPDPRVKFETSSSVGNLDWERMRLIGAHPNSVVLVDHYAIEERFSKVLLMLHAFDEDRCPKPQSSK